MKLFLDENLPHQLRHEIPRHECITVAFMNWSGVEYEQNLVNLPLAVVVIHAASNDIDDIRPLLPRLLNLLATPLPKQIVHAS